MGRFRDPSLVILAAGSATRFGGPKQLVEVGAEGAAIMDVLLGRAADAGFERAVIVVNPAIEALVGSHLDGRVAPGIPVELAVQEFAAGRSRPLGTADAVLAARASVNGSFAVVNADDLYPADAFAALAGHLRAASEEHAMVAFRVGRTLIGSRPVSRALIEVDDESRLVAIREGAIVPTGGGLRFDTPTSQVPLTGNEYVSMNMWGFRAALFDALADAVAAFIAAGLDGEVYLPDVVAASIESGATVRVLVSESVCIGLTHPDDVGDVRAALR